MYRYKYTYKKSADMEDFNRIYTVISEKYPELKQQKKREEKFENIIFLTPEDEKEFICLTLDKSEESLEIFSEERLDFLSGFRTEKLPSAESLAVNSLSRGTVIAYEFGFLIMNLIMGWINSDSFSLGFMTGGFDGPFDEPLNNFLRCLPFAAVYFFSYRFIKRNTGYIGIHIRFIQLGGIVTVAAIPICVILGFLSTGLGLAVIILLMCAVNIALYAMVTAIVLEFMAEKIIGK